MTKHRYDAAGRLTSSTTTTETEWDREERAWMIALATYRNQVHDCGTWLPYATRPEDEGAFRAELPVRCHVCTARGVAMAAYMKGANPNPEALLWPVTRRR